MYLGSMHKKQSFLDWTSCREKIFWKEFIDLYRSFPCLYDTKHQGYRNKNTKRAAMEVLLKKVQSVDPDGDMNFVQTKIKNMRSVFNREYKRQKLSMKYANSPEEIYKPNLWYFDLWKFIVAGKNGNQENDDNDDNNDNTDNNDNNDNDEEDDDNGGKGQKFERIDEDDIFINDESSDSLVTEVKNPLAFEESPVKSSSSTSPIFVQKYTVKNPYEGTSTQKSDLTVATKKDSDDEYSIVGKRIAYQLKSMTDDQRLICEKLISDVTFYGQLGKLKENSRLVL